MSHNNHTTHNSIRELTKDGMTVELLEQMADGWVDPFPAPVIEKVSKVFMPDSKIYKSFNVIRDDLPEVGSKGRFGSLLMQRLKHDTVVYVAPRAGWAPISLAKLCQMYDKRLILFAPASRIPSTHQQVAMELGAEMRFYRVAAMPNLQAKAEAFAKKHGYFFAPLGLRHPLVTAAIYATTKKLLGNKPKGEMWCAMSTGVLSRGMQLALPKWEHHGVAVARNIQDGERGNAKIWSHPYPFLQDEMPGLQPPFPSASNYDAKVWRFMREHARNGAYMWNVAGNIEPSKPLPKGWTKSDKAWGDESAFRRK